DLRAPAVFYTAQRDPAPTVPHPAAGRASRQGGDLERGECREAQSAGWARPGRV
ncbi:hypothetical protein P7K49_027317, partial [Saguinus oedipus]